MVIDLIDRQSNAIAQTVFGEQVEKKMIQLGRLSEANFCRQSESGTMQKTRLD